MKRIVISIICLVWALSGRAQETRQLSFLMVEKVFGDAYYNDLVRSSEIAHQELNWVNSGRAYGDHANFMYSLKYVQKLLEQPEGQRQWSYDASTRILKHNGSIQANSILQRHLKTIELAYQVFPEKWLLEALKINSIQQSAFFKLFYDKWSQPSTDIVLKEIRTFNHFYEFSLSHFSAVFGERSVRNQMAIQAKILAQRLLIEKFFEAIEKSDLSMQQFAQLVSDLGEGKGLFGAMNERLKIKLDYMGPAGINYYDLIRDQHRRVCNALILEFDLNIPTFDMAVRPNLRSGERNYTRVEKGQSGYEVDPLILSIREKISPIVRTMK